MKGVVLPLFSFSQDRIAGKSKNDSPEMGNRYPSLPVGSWLPIGLPSFFLGREEYLAALQSNLSSTNIAAVPVILYGTPGSGKTQLAAVYCFRFSSLYEGVHWIEAAQPDEIQTQIVECGRQMNLSPWPEKLADQLEVTLNSWRQFPNRLVVFNHASAPEVICDWLKKIGRVPVLVTTSVSESEWPVEYSIHNLGVLKREESIVLLRRLAPRLQKNSDEELAHLAESLGDTPFALDLAGRYLNERSKVSIKEYLLDVEKTASGLDEGITRWIKREQVSVSPKIAAVITLSFRILANKGERERVAQNLLYLASFCAPNIPIPVEIFQQALENKLEKLQLIEWSLAWLYSLGLLQQTRFGPVSHSLISEFAHLENTQVGTSFPPLAEALQGLTEDTRSKALPLWIGQSHLRAAAAWAEYAGLKHAGALLSNLGALLMTSGELADSKACLEHALAFDERLLGLENIKIASIASKLGRVNSQLGDLDVARKYFERALAVTEKVFSPVYPELGIILNDLGEVLFDLGDLIGAKASFERAISIYETAYGYGPKHPAVAIAAGNLGRVLRDMNDLHGAKTYFERALAVDEWVYGPKHPSIATRANYLGKVLYKLGDLNGSRTCFERVAQLLETINGPDYPGLAIAFNNLGLVLQDLGNVTKARDCFLRALEIDEKFLGSEHPNVARDSNNLGGAYSALGNLPAARDCFKRALEIDEKIFGPEHANNATNANNLGRVLYNLGDLLGAKKAFERTLAIDEKTYGVVHAKVGTDLNNLGIVVYDIGELVEAKVYFERALVIFRKEFAPDHPKIAKAQKYLNRIIEK